ncbi:MAG: OsmC family protein [Nitrospiria bacterium]
MKADTSSTSKILTYEVIARVVGPGLSRAECKQASIEFDTSAGQSQTHMGPAELLVSAFAACVLKNVERFSGILPFAYQGASIRVIAEREEEPPRITKINYILRVTTNEPPNKVDLLHRNIQKFGTIFNTIASACQVSGEVIVEAPSGAE